MAKLAARGALLGLLALLAIMPLDGRSLLDRAFALVAPECTVGLSGTAVSVTVAGGGTGACDDWVRSDPANPWYPYAAGTEPAGAVICQGQQSGRTYTVRDQGLLNIYGTSICSALSGQATADILRRVADGVTNTEGQPGDQPLEATYACGYRLVGHNLTVLVYGAGCESISSRLPHEGIGWDSFDPVTTGGTPADGRQICAGYLFDLYAEVVDTGGATYATDVCDLVVPPGGPMD
jgi:hypothetical protein